jgi:hypothetical protein
MGKQKDGEPNNQALLPDQWGDFNKTLMRHVGYHEYLDNFEDRPPLAGCTGPISFDEWNEFMNAMEPLLNPSKPPTKPE